MMDFSSGMLGLPLKLLFANGDQFGLSGWVLFVLFLVLVFIVTWLLFSNTRYSGGELEHGTHDEHAAHDDHAEPVHSEMVDTPEPVVEEGTQA